MLLSGTVVSSLVALAVAIPLGTNDRQFTCPSSRRSAVREIAKPFLELLGGVPTIVYGYFALLYVTPALQFFFPRAARLQPAVRGPGHGHHDHSLHQFRFRGCDAVGAMAMREGSYAMGATRFQTAVRVVTPAAFSGIAAAYILGISRAVGGNHDRGRGRGHAA